MKKNTKRDMTKHQNQKGMAILSILAVILVITLYGTTSFINVQKDVENTFKDFKAIKADYVSSAAMAWAIAVVQRASSYDCPTHKPNGTDKYVWNEVGKPADDCNSDPDYTNDKYKLDSTISANISLNWLGWVKTVISKANGDVTLTGADKETLLFKMWFDTDSTMRITAVGNYDGLKDTVELFGELN